MNQVLPQNSLSESLQSLFDGFEESPTLVEKSSKKSAAKQPNMFLSSLHQILEIEEYQAMINWDDEGTSFIIMKPELFAETVLPKYYKHNKLLSFVRQKQTHVKGFLSYKHPLFLKESKHLLNKIERSKNYRKYLKPKAPAKVEESQQFKELTLSNQMLQDQNQILTGKLKDATAQVEFLRTRSQMLESELNGLKSYVNRYEDRNSQFFNMNMNMNMRNQMQDYQPVYYYNTDN